MHRPWHLQPPIPAPLHSATLSNRHPAASLLQACATCQTGASSFSRRSLLKTWPPCCLECHPRRCSLWARCCRCGGEGVLPCLLLHVLRISPHDSLLSSPTLHRSAVQPRPPPDGGAGAGIQLVPLRAAAGWPRSIAGHCSRGAGLSSTGGLLCEGASRLTTCAHAAAPTSPRFLAQVECGTDIAVRLGQGSIGVKKQAVKGSGGMQGVHGMRPECAK